MSAVLVRLAVVAGLCIAAAASGCRSNPPAAPSAPTPTAVSSPSPTVDAREQQETAGVLAAYNGFREAYITAAATSDFNDKTLPSYIADPLLAEVRFALRQTNGQGIVYKGRPTWSAKVPQLNVTTRPYTATIEDCFDATGWDAVYKTTGKPAAVTGQAKRYLATSTATLYDNGRWLISSSKADRSRPC